MKWIVAWLLLSAVAYYGWLKEDVDQKQAYCDHVLAEAAVSSAANKKFGWPLELSDSEYAKRSAWVNEKFAELEQKFSAEQRWPLDEVNDEGIAKGWPVKCNPGG